MKPVEHLKPMEIERRSFEIITQELAGRIPEDEKAPVIKRVIHTSADFDYAENLVFSEGAVARAQDVLKNGVSVVTDTNMAKAGINKKILSGLGGAVHCFMADADVAEEAKKRGVTRAAVSMEKAAAMGKPFIAAIGNAPTALIRLKELIDAGKAEPELIIGVPVGFVNVVESKELIIQSGIPYIVAKGRKGGSSIAAAIVNALLYQIQEREG